MKKSIILSFVILICWVKSFSQKIRESDLPSPVKASFTKIYPGSSAKWEKENENYEAGFKKDGKKMSAMFQPDGTFMESETEIKESELPPAVVNYVKSNYPNKKIKESAKINSAAGVMSYEAAIADKDLIFESNGRFLMEVKN